MSPKENRQPPNYIPPDFVQNMTPTPALDGFFDRPRANSQPITSGNDGTLGTIEGRKIAAPRRGPR
jgi:hypothetical protein